MRVLRLSALCTGRHYPTRNIPGTHLCKRMRQPQVHSVANSSDTIGNRTRELPACSALPQPTTPPRTPFARKVYWNSPRDLCAQLFTSYRFIIGLLGSWSIGCPATSVSYHQSTVRNIPEEGRSNSNRGGTLTLRGPKIVTGQNWWSSDARLDVRQAN
jgi:hypothetical protein